MNVPDELRVMLSDVEDRLAERLQSAIEERIYSDIATIAAVSQRLSELIAELEHGEIGSRGNGATDAPTAPTRLKPPAIDPKGRRHMNRQAYPKFARDGDRLVKVGWSKKAKSEYEHKASHSTVLTVTEELRKLEAKEFSMEGMLPISDSSGKDLPSYQAYLVLAWLCSLGVVRREGRGGYVPVKAGLDPASIAAHWDQLVS